MKTILIIILILCAGFVFLCWGDEKESNTGKDLRKSPPQSRQGHPSEKEEFLIRIDDVGTNPSAVAKCLKEHIGPVALYRMLPDHAFLYGLYVDPFHGDPPGKMLRQHTPNEIKARLTRQDALALVKKLRDLGAAASIVDRPEGNEPHKKKD